MDSFIPLEDVGVLGPCTVSPFHRKPLCKETLITFLADKEHLKTLDDDTKALYGHALRGDADAGAEMIRRMDAHCRIADKVNNLVREWHAAGALDVDTVTIIYPDRINGTNKAAITTAEYLAELFSRSFHEQGLSVRCHATPAYQLQETGRSDTPLDSILGPPCRFASPSLFKEHDVREAVIVMDHNTDKGTTLAAMGSYARHFGRTVLGYLCVYPGKTECLSPSAETREEFPKLNAATEHNLLEGVLRKMGVSLGKSGTFEGTSLTDAEMKDIGKAITGRGFQDTIRSLQDDLQAYNGMPALTAGMRDNIVRARGAPQSEQSV